MVKDFPSDFQRSRRKIRSRKRILRALEKWPDVAPYPDFGDYGSAYADLRYAPFSDLTRTRETVWFRQAGAKALARIFENWRAHCVLRPESPMLELWVMEAGYFASSTVVCAWSDKRVSHYRGVLLEDPEPKPLPVEWRRLAELQGISWQSKFFTIEFYPNFFNPNDTRLMRWLEKNVQEKFRTREGDEIWILGAHRVWVGSASK
jgi:hypothetical protein